MGKNEPVKMGDLQPELQGRTIYLLTAEEKPVTRTSASGPSAGHDVLLLFSSQTQAQDYGASEPNLSAPEVRQSTIDELIEYFEGRVEYCIVDRTAEQSTAQASGPTVGNAGTGIGRETSGFVKLSCSSCGASLTIANEIDRLACGYCGSEYVARRGGGIVSLVPVAESVRRIEAGVDRTASELAISRLWGEVAYLENQKQQIELHLEKIDRVYTSEEDMERAHAEHLKRRKKLRKNRVVAGLAILVGIGGFFLTDYSDDYLCTGLAWAAMLFWGVGALIWYLVSSPGRIPIPIPEAVARDRDEARRALEERQRAIASKHHQLEKLLEVVSDRGETDSAAR